MHRFGKLSMVDAIRIVDEYDSMSAEEFEQKIAGNWKRGIINTDGLSEYDLTVRETIKNVFDIYYKLADGNKNKMYPLDLYVGLKIYELLDPEKSEFTISDAADDDMWRYISVKVLPDMTHLRYPPTNELGARNINKKRFYSEKRRIWIKSLWWYIYLSWQGNKEATYQVLKGNAIDNINKLIETPGRGYRLSLYRTLMREYALRSQYNTDYFAGVTKLNNAKCKTVEPSLLRDGEIEYVRILLDSVQAGKEKEENNA